MLRPPHTINKPSQVYCGNCWAHFDFSHVCPRFHNNTTNDMAAGDLGLRCNQINPSGLAARSPASHFRCACKSIPPQHSFDVVHSSIRILDMVRCSAVARRRLRPPLVLMILLPRTHKAVSTRISMVVTMMNHKSVYHGISTPKRSTKQPLLKCPSPNRSSSGSMHPRLSSHVIAPSSLTLTRPVSTLPG